MTQLYKPKSSVRKGETDNLFSGFWIRWRAMTVAERFVCANIVLVPVWWIVGLYKYMPLLLLLGVALYEWLQYGKIHLKRPRLPVVALFAFGTYQLVKILFYYYTSERDSVSEIVFKWFCPAFLLWYIQSKNIRIRMEVVAWACTVSVVQMIGFWFLLQFVLPTTIFSTVHPTLFAQLTGKGLNADDFGRLAPYQSSGAIQNLKELHRYSLFFISAEVFGVVAGFLGLVALEIKNHLWSLLLFLACVFLILLSASRAVWVAFPIVLCLRYMFSTFGKTSGSTILFALIAVASFTLLSIPQATDLISDNFTFTAQFIAEFRQNSTNDRLEIYRQTWKALQENPLWGHITTGTLISLNDPSYNVVGSHSLILGRLLYSNGFAGTGIFLVFWISLFIWLYETRAGRPLICFCLLLLYTLVSPTMASLYDMPLSSVIILLCAAIRRPKLKSAPN